MKIILIRVSIAIILSSVLTGFTIKHDHIRIKEKRYDSLFIKADSAFNVKYQEINNLLDSLLKQ